MVENPPANAGDMGSSPGPGRSHIKKKYIYIYIQVIKRRKKERREQPNQETNPPMITSVKNYTHKKMDRQNPRTNGKSKAIQTKSHKEAYTQTPTKGEKGKKYIYCKKKEESNPINKQIYQ